MSAPLKYETPENVQIEYRLAGMGTRFLAWFVDAIIVNLVIFLLLIGIVIVAAISTGPLHDLFEQLDPEKQKSIKPETIVLYIIGIGTLIWGFTSFFYFGLCELLLRGQTVGKRLCKIRVVKSDGFALTALGVFVRNIFRIIDNVPALWITPVLSKRGQRFGDMVAGTLVVSDESEDLPEVREQLSSRNPAEARFRFDNAKLSRLSRDNFDALERILDRWNSLPQRQKDVLLNKVVGPLCRKMQTDEPAENDRVEFLEDLLAAEYRRQDRHLR